MNAVKFIEERNRMCKSFGDKCTRCPALKVHENELYCAVDIRSTLDDTSQVAIVEGWSAAHPRRTRQSVFLEHYPNAPRDRNKLLTACPKCLDADVSCVDKNATVGKIKSCDVCRREFWGQEVE